MYTGFCEPVLSPERERVTYLLEKKNTPLKKRKNRRLRFHVYVGVQNRKFAEEKSRKEDTRKKKNRLMKERKEVRTFYSRKKNPTKLN